MKYEFTDGTRIALQAARDEALRLRHAAIGPEHILLGVLREADTPVALALEALRLDGEQVRQQVERCLPPGLADWNPRRGELPYKSAAKKTLELAMEEGRRTGRNVSPAELLVGVLREETAIPAVVLRSLGVTVERLRDGVRRAHAGETVEPSFLIAIDESSDRSIYEQIVAQVQEAVATGVLRPGERLPTVRRLADDLDIAPGTVARAWVELERLGVVVTEGARGTRVAEPAVAAKGRVDPDTLSGLLRPVAVAAFHMGAGAEDVRAALEVAMRGIFEQAPPSA